MKTMRNMKRLSLKNRIIALLAFMINNISLGADTMDALENINALDVTGETSFMNKNTLMAGGVAAVAGSAIFGGGVYYVKNKSENEEKKKAEDRAKEIVKKDEEIKKIKEEADKNEKIVLAEKQKKDALKVKKEKFIKDKELLQQKEVEFTTFKQGMDAIVQKQKSGTALTEDEEKKLQEFNNKTEEINKLVTDIQKIDGELLKEDPERISQELQKHIDKETRENKIKDSKEALGQKEKKIEELNIDKQKYTELINDIEDCTNNPSTEKKKALLTKIFEIETHIDDNGKNNLYTLSDDDFKSWLQTYNTDVKKKISSYEQEISKETAEKQKLDAEYATIRNEFEKENKEHLEKLEKSEKEKEEKIVEINKLKNDLRKKEENLKVVTKKLQEAEPLIERLKKDNETFKEDKERKNIYIGENSYFVSKVFGETNKLFSEFNVLYKKINEDKKKDKDSGIKQEDLENFNQLMTKYLRNGGTSLENLNKIKERVNSEEFAFYSIEKNVQAYLEIASVGLEGMDLFSRSQAKIHKEQIMLNEAIIEQIDLFDKMAKKYQNASSVNKKDYNSLCVLDKKINQAIGKSEIEFIEVNNTTKEEKMKKLEKNSSSNRSNEELFNTKVDKEAQNIYLANLVVENEKRKTKMQETNYELKSKILKNEEKKNETHNKMEKELQKYYNDDTFSLCAEILVAKFIDEKEISKLHKIVGEVNKAKQDIAEYKEGKEERQVIDDSDSEEVMENQQEEDKIKIAEGKIENFKNTLKSAKIQINEYIDKKYQEIKKDMLFIIANMSSSLGIIEVKNGFDTLKSLEEAYAVALQEKHYLEILNQYGVYEKKSGFKVSSQKQNNNGHVMQPSIPHVGKQNQLRQHNGISKNSGVLGNQEEIKVLAKDYDTRIIKLGQFISRLEDIQEIMERDGATEENSNINQESRSTNILYNNNFIKETDEKTAGLKKSLSQLLIKNTQLNSSELKNVLGFNESLIINKINEIIENNLISDRIKYLSNIQKSFKRLERDSVNEKENNKEKLSKLLHLIDQEISSYNVLNDDRPIIAIVAGRVDLYNYKKKIENALEIKEIKTKKNKLNKLRSDFVTTIEIIEIMDYDFAFVPTEQLDKMQTTIYSIVEREEFNTLNLQTNAEIVKKYFELMVNCDFKKDDSESIEDVEREGDIEENQELEESVAENETSNSQEEEAQLAKLVGSLQFLETLVEELDEILVRSVNNELEVIYEKDVITKDYQYQIAQIEDKKQGIKNEIENYSNNIDLTNTNKKEKLNVLQNMLYKSEEEIKKLQQKLNQEISILRSSIVKDMKERTRSVIYYEQPYQYMSQEYLQYEESDRNRQYYHLSNLHEQEAYPKDIIKRSYEEKEVENFRKDLSVVSEDIQRAEQMIKQLKEEIEQMQKEGVNQAFIDSKTKALEYACTNLTFLYNKKTRLNALISNREMILSSNQSYAQDENGQDSESSLIYSVEPPRFMNSSNNKNQEEKYEFQSNHINEHKDDETKQNQAERKKKK